MSALARRIQSALRLMSAEGRELVSSPPFTIFVAPDPALPFLTFAIPDAGAGPPWTEASIAALRAEFAAHSRESRLDVVEACWPRLAEALVAAGFEIEHRLPGLVATPPMLSSGGAPADLVIEEVGRDSPQESIAALLAVQRAAFPETGDPRAVDAVAIEFFRQVGVDSLLARLPDGTPVGVAGHLAVHDGVSEIVAVGVEESQRGRGIGGALTVAAARSAARAGAELLFITPDNERAAGVYERVGFEIEPGCEVLKLRAASLP